MTHDSNSSSSNNTKLSMGKRLLRELQFMSSLVLGLIALFFFVGPVLMFTGIVLITAKDTRTSGIIAYNNAVTQWKNEYYEQFTYNGLQFGYSIRINGTEDSVNLDLDRSNHDILHDNKLSHDPIPLETYQELKFTKKHVPLLTDDTLGVFNETLFRNISFTRQYCPDCPVEVMTTLKVRPFVRVAMPQNDAATATILDCLKQGGQWNEETAGPATCEFYYNLHSICVKVHKDSAGNWQVDEQQQGCFLLTNMPRYNETTGVAEYVTDWSPFFYRLVRHAPDAAIFVGTIEVSVRHDMDPYIAAYRITDGTLNFGVTKRQKTIAGIIVFFVGVGVALVLAGVLIKEAVVERRELFTGANNNNNKAKRRRSIWDAPKDSNNNNENESGVGSV